MITEIFQQEPWLTCTVVSISEVCCFLLHLGIIYDVRVTAPPISGLSQSQIVYFPDPGGKLKVAVHTKRLSLCPLPA